MDHGAASSHGPDKIHNHSKHFLKKLRCAQTNTQQQQQQKTRVKAFVLILASHPRTLGLLTGYSVSPILYHFLKDGTEQSLLMLSSGTPLSPAHKALVEHSTPWLERACCLDG